MLRSLRSELVRLRRPGLLVAWLGLTALFATMVNTIMFSVAADGAALPAGAPGVALPTAAELAASRGLMAGMPAASTMFGLLALSFWAIAVATDYSTGLIRLLVAAMPRRWPLLAGRVVALALLTAASTTVAAVVTLAVSPAAARGAGVDTSAWTDGALGTVLGTWASTLLALLVWGVVGLAIASVTRSAAIAISVGAGWVLVVEPMLGRLFDATPDWLLGSTLTTVAQQGSGTGIQGGAMALAGLYVAVGLGAGALVLMRRDVTD
jgi:ABC-type transport system involved in multi-copper enzyme maturation permease subunit